MKLLQVLSLTIVWLSYVLAQKEEDGRHGTDRLKIEGFIERPFGIMASDSSWFSRTRVYTEAGQTAFIREDGSFVLHNLAWGVHLLFVASPDVTFAPVRVDLAKTGKMRVRKFNILQPAKLEVIPGPLRMTPLGHTKYFQEREVLRVTDLIMSPMVLMTVLPLALLLVMPRLVDPETKKTFMEQQATGAQIAGGANNATPDLAEMMASFFKSPAPDKKECRAATAGAAPASKRRREK